ncbi:histone deacetylase family protein [Tranquillimonas alkanivorans]|uniref:Acetoin utilization deacetylase AcuC n=1 Tax=Tranquillimonas alkanivorans TaxID=441119 RepID=A0A1I5U3Y2_9RHOB|nr:histone deacetylase family protein [Tranquillimonas alkanivorans]SFP89960.1 Acetoin utilization deacetylase AcuC [Tranquillimonas alkanivorans]
MTTLYLSHLDCLNHVTPSGHPERAVRIEAITAAIADERFASLVRQDAPLVEDADILRCHPQKYLDRLSRVEPEGGWKQLDPDTHMSDGTLLAARRGAGGCCAAVDAVLAGEVANAFVGCRPPGHHAETETAMGFCLFGNAAIAAKRALDHHGLSRVAVLDFDVHHGNGTQDLLWDEPRTLFCSSHQMPLFPGTGAESETGAHRNVINVPLRPLTGGAEMRRAWEGAILPAVARFEPELIIVSAGFDAHAADPLAQLNWTVEDFAWLTGRICDVADDVCGGHVVSTLEGGYDLDALAAGVAAHVTVLMERGG